MPYLLIRRENSTSVITDMSNRILAFPILQMTYHHPQMRTPASHAGASYILLNEQLIRMVVEEIEKHPERMPEEFSVLAREVMRLGHVKSSPQTFRAGVACQRVHLVNPRSGKMWRVIAYVRHRTLRLIGLLQSALEMEMA
jgi:hypothetical protein